MSMKTTLLFALLLVGAPAVHATDAQPTSEAAVAPAAESKADPDEKVCKVERELGSNKMKRVCRTRAQVDADREAARDALTREQRR